MWINLKSASPWLIRLAGAQVNLKNTWKPMEKFLTNSAKNRNFFLKKMYTLKIFKKPKILTFGDLQGLQMASPRNNSTAMHLILGKTSIYDHPYGPPNSTIAG